MGNIQGNEKSKSGKSPAKSKHFIKNLNRKSPGRESKKHGKKKSDAKRDAIDREFDKTPDSDNAIGASDNDMVECTFTSTLERGAPAEVKGRCARSPTRGQPAASPANDSTSDSVFTDPLTPLAVELNQCYYSAESDSTHEELPRTLTPSQTDAPARPDSLSSTNMPHDDATSLLSNHDKEEKVETFDDISDGSDEKVMGAILSKSRAEQLDRSSHECSHDFLDNRLKASPGQTSFVVSKHRKVELTPVTCEPSLSIIDSVSDIDRRHSSLSEASMSDSNVLRKVASLTLDKHSESRVHRPRFVPEKLNFQIYEKFEGQMLLNWFLSSISENNNLKHLLSPADLKNIGVQYCTHLLAAGVLRQIVDKDAPTETIFKPNLMYYWAHMEVPASQPVTPGRLQKTSWPPDKDIFQSGEHISIRCDLENKFQNNQNNNEEISDINEARLAITQLKKKLQDLEYQLEKYKLNAQIDALNKNLENHFDMPSPHYNKTEIIRKEVQTANNIKDFNKSSYKPVINIPDSSLKTSVNIDNALDLSSVTKDIENKPEYRSDKIENYCKLNKSREYNEIIRKEDKNNESNEKSVSNESLTSLNRVSKNCDYHNSNSIDHESSSEASFLSTLNSTELIKSLKDNDSEGVDSMSLKHSNTSSKTKCLYLNNSKQVEGKSDCIKTGSPLTLLPTTCNDVISNAVSAGTEVLPPTVDTSPLSKLSSPPFRSPPPPLPGMAPPPPPTPGTETNTEPSLAQESRLKMLQLKTELLLTPPGSGAKCLTASILSPTTTNVFTATKDIISSSINAESSHITNLASPSKRLKSPITTTISKPPLLTGAETALPILSKVTTPTSPMSETRTVIAEYEAVGDTEPHPPLIAENPISPILLQIPEKGPQPPPMPVIGPPPPSMPGMGPPPPPMPGMGPPPPPMPGMSPPPPPMPGMCPPPPPMPGMGPLPPPMPGMSPPPPPMPGVGPPPPPMPGVGPPPPPMPGMGPPPPPMPGVGPPPPPIPGVGPPPPPMPGMGPPPPPMPGVGLPPPPMPGIDPTSPASSPAPPPMPGSVHPPIPGAGSYPPPPVGPAPFPAPPVGGWTMQRATLRKTPVKPAAPMKPLYWTRILAHANVPQHQEDSESKVLKPLWLEIEEANLDNIEEFTDLFSRQVIKAPVKKKVEVKTKIQPIKILDSKRSQNVGILAQSLHVEFSEIENAIYNFDTSVVSLEALQQIYELRATEEELQMIKEHLKTKPEIPLDKPESFLHDLSGIPNFAERISCFMFQAEFEDAISVTMHKLDNLKHTCEFLITNESLKKLFAIILTLGNYMNGGNGQRGQADGFGLEILSKLRDVKSKQSTVTLLHFIVRTYMRAAGALGALPVPEPGDVARAAAIDFGHVRAHLDALALHLHACKEKSHKVIEADAQSQHLLDDSMASESKKRLEVFKEKMTAFLHSAEEKLKIENENLEECRNKFITTVKFYQYSPKCGKVDDCEPEEFFSLWTTFCSDFKDIYKREEQLAIKEKLKENKKLQEERKSLTQPKKEGGLKARLQKLSNTKK